MVALWWLVVAGIGVVAWLVVRAQTEEPVSETLGSEFRHVNTEVAYPQVPPTQGDHHPVWWDCGSYSEPIPPEHALHSLEHGAVWITHRPDIGAAEVERLRGLMTRGHLLLSPLSDQDAPVVLTAWRAQLSLERADLDRATAFIATHRLGSAAPESGGLCTNGTTRDLVDRSAR